VKTPLARLGWLLVAVVTGSGAAIAGDTGFLDRSVTLDGVTYRYQVYLPVDYTPDKPWPIALFLHGSGERGDDGSVQTQVGIPAAIRSDRKRFPMIVVMPQARPNTRWTGAMAAQALKALDQSIAEFHGDPQRVYLTGLSMGGQGVWFMAARNPHKFAALAPISSFIRIENDDDVIDPAQDKALLVQYPEVLAKDPFAAFARQIGKTPVWIFHGGADDVVPVEQARQFAKAMRAVGAEVRYSEYEGGNHGAWDRAYGEPELVSWLLSHRLDQR
jgi:predicted peptidase